MDARRSLLVMPLLLVGSVACGCRYACDEEDTRVLSSAAEIPSAEGCPRSADAADALGLHDRLELVGDLELVGSRLAAPSRTVCWYRAKWDRRRSCPETRSDLAARAAATEPVTSLTWPARADTEPSSSCDEAGALWAEVIVDVPRAPTVCPPAPANTPAVKGLSVTELVGRDQYPPRMACEYAFAYRGTCSSELISPSPAR